MTNPLLGVLRSQAVRNAIPRRVKAFYAENSSLFTRVRARSEARNIYHCCVHKTGSQWIRKLLSDRRTYAYSGLRPYHYQSRLSGGDRRPIKERGFGEPFPPGRIVSPLYIDFQRFAELPKPGHYRGFFVSRDPRDILVSWYFSTKQSHPGKRQDVHRGVLQQLPQTAGLAYGFELLKEQGLFAALGSWERAPERDANVIVVRYEELVGERREAEFRRLFEHLDLAFPEAVLRSLLDEYSFQSLSGRRPGQEEPKSKFRKGIAGDWRNYLDDELVRRFETVLAPAAPAARNAEGASG